MRIKPGDMVALTANGDGFLAYLHVEQIYHYNKRELARAIFGTEDTAHPGVADVFAKDDALVGGKITLIRRSTGALTKYRLTPLETREEFNRRGWKTVVGFQTRNIPHLGHEYIQKTALTFFDGLFINPVVGKKKAGDFKDEVILEAYRVLIENYYPRERVFLSTLETAMRYAGPREAVFHAIIRKNFGCTHFIVGRDHAGVGSYYSPYAAQEIFTHYPDLEISPLFFPAFFYCKRCGWMVNDKICPHPPDARVEFSGTRLRSFLWNGESSSLELVRPEVADIIRRWSDPLW